MINSAKFVISVANGKEILDVNIAEIAVAGRSNVGKSSFINMITNNGKLAKTSKLPGRTRLLNYFSCNNDEFMLVDLPGYGFAKVSDVEKDKWGKLIEYYFQNSKNLRNVFLLVDIRHKPSNDDFIMVNYFYHYNIPFTIIATKADKLSRSAASTRRREIAADFKVGIDNIYLTSCFNKTGKPEIFQRINQILSFKPQIEESTEDSE